MTFILIQNYCLVICEIFESLSENVCKCVHTTEYFIDAFFNSDLYLCSDFKVLSMAVVFLDVWNTDKCQNDGFIIFVFMVTDKS